MILLSLFSMVVFGLVAGGATYAIMSGSASNGGNTFQSGTLQIQVANDQISFTDSTETLNVPVRNLAPGDKGSESMEVKNTGTLDLKYDVLGILTNGNVPFTNVDPAQDMQLTYAYSADNGTTWTTIVPGDNNVVLASGATHHFKVNYQLPQGADNRYQNASATLQLKFLAEQLRNNGGNPLPHPVGEPTPIEGTITDALTGRGIPNLTLTFTPQEIRTIAPMAARSLSAESVQPTVYTVTTDQFGHYWIQLPSGEYVLRIAGQGYVTYVSAPMWFWPGMPNQNHFNQTLTPPVAEGETRIILNWGSVPADLDSHLTGPTKDDGRFHVWYWQQNFFEDGVRKANLDVDDTSSYGPETITISKQNAGKYRYSIHDYTNRRSQDSSALGLSGATVQVYQGNNLVKTFAVPNQPGTLWTVFELNGTTITPVNHMSYEASDGSGVPNQALRSASVETDAHLLQDLPEKE